MITTEKDYGARLRSIFMLAAKAREQSCHWQRIEASTALGIPDVNMGMGGKEGWIELKIRHGKQPIVYQPHQRAWWAKAALAGRSGCILVWNPKEELDEVWKFHLSIADFVKHCVLNRENLGCEYHTSFLLTHVFSSCQYED